MDIRIDADGLTRLTRDLRRAGRRQIPRDLQRSLRRHVAPLVPAVRAAIRATPSHGRPRSSRSVTKRPHGLRDAEARGVQTVARLSTRAAALGVRITPRLFPAGSKSVVLYREGVRGPWRARNWGRDDWHVQPAHPAFYPTIRPRLPTIRERVERDVTDLIERLSGDDH